MKSNRKKPSKNDLSANVSTLKTHLGRFLKKVKEGEEVIVMDRQMPVAKLVAFSGDENATVEIAPSKEWNAVIKEIKARPYKTKRLKKSVMSYLKDDRGE